MSKPGKSVKAALIRAVKGTEIGLERLQAAFSSLSEEDRKQLEYVERMIALES